MSGPALAGPDWTAREVALDAERLAPRLAEALPGDRARGATPHAEAQLLKENAGRRCVIRYRLGGGARLAGKLYRDRERGERCYRRLVALRASLGAGPARCIPAPLAWLPDLGLLLQEWRDGGDLREALARGEAPRAAEAAAGWLAALHASPPPPGLKQRTLAYEVSRLHRFAETAERGVGRSWPALREARDGLAAAAATLGAYAPAAIHKDFYYAHVLWDGSGLSVLDFDELSVGDPAFDVGHFLGHLDRLAERAPERAAALPGVGERFLGAHPAARAPGFAARVAFYRGYTAMKLAATEVRRAEPGWERRGDLFVARAAALARELARGAEASA